jgi:tetratricopeptide (TPR) repeat protein
MSYFSARSFADALEQERLALDLYPNRLLYRGNHAFFAMYASEFKIAAESAERLIIDYPQYYPGHQLKAMAAVATGELATAEETYRSMTLMDEPAASIGVIGLADLAIHQGRFDDSIAMLEVRIAEDLQNDNPPHISTKYLLLGEALQAAGELARGVSAATTALEHGRGEQVLLATARMLIKAGQMKEAGALADELEFELETEPRAFAKIIEGEMALAEGRMGDAFEAFNDALELVDDWLVRFDLGRLYVEANRYPEALRELELSETRRGEGAAFFLDDLPTFRYMTSLPYWLGRAREGMGMTTAAVESYEAFLALRDENSPDPLAADARARARR